MSTTTRDALAIRQSELAAMPFDILEAMEYRLDWVNGPATKVARPDQLPPDPLDHDWFTWMQLGGRGSGKTRTGAEWIWYAAYCHPGSRWAIIAPTQSDARKTCFEGESGLLARCPPSLISNYNRQELILTLHNGSQIFGYSAQEPDRLRGPQHHGAWCDELASWQYLDDALDNLLMGMRLGKQPRMIITTTPRPIKRLKEIVASKTTRVDRVSTYANKGNLPAHFLNIILKRYEGTRLGRQELMAEIVDDVPGALWTRANLDEHRVRPDPKTGMVLLPDMEELVIAVDPAITSKAGSDETGIVAVGRGTDKLGYVLHDESMSGTPGAWARRAVELYDFHQAGFIVYEANQGGDMVAETLRNAALAMKAEGVRDTDYVALKEVWASRGKVTRAEPVSALYEQGRVKHVGMLAKLEDQMCEFTSDFDRKNAGYSPDRVDALVWGLTRVMGTSQGTGILEFYRQEAEAMANGTHRLSPGNGAPPETTARAWSSPTPEAAKPVTPLLGMRGVASKVLQRKPLCVLLPPPSVNTAYGRTGKRYDVGADGTITVEDEDVAPLMSAGFRKQMETTQ